MSMCYKPVCANVCYCGKLDRAVNDACKHNFRTAAKSGRGGKEDFSTEAEEAFILLLPGDTFLKSAVCSVCFRQAW